MISSWCTDVAPCRWAVPRQSAPVSPPPMMTTRFPFALIGDAGSTPSRTRFDGFRYSMARWTPSSSRPGTGRSRGSVAPAASTTASNSARTSAAGFTAHFGSARRPHRTHLTRLPRAVAGRGFLVAPHRRPAHERDALRLHLGQAPVHHGLLHLELGDAVAEQAARPLAPLEHGHRVTRPRELLRRRQAGRPRAHHGHRLSGAHRWHLRRDPALRPGPLDDLVLDPLNRHRVFVDAEHARGLAGRGAQPPRELREVVGRVQALHGLGPVVAVDEVVPLGDEVPEWAAVVAERDAAVHAPGALLLGRFLAEGLVHLAPVAQRAPTPAAGAAASARIP